MSLLDLDAKCDMKMKSEFEEDKYSELISEMKDKLKQRFYWSMKDDNWLYLDVL
jgi:hypothetical protein